MNGSSPSQYFYLPYEFRPEFDYPDLTCALAKGGTPPWQFVPSYPSPPMSSPPSPPRKLSDIQPPPATTFSELNLSGTTTTTTTTHRSSISSIFAIPPGVTATAPQTTRSFGSSTGIGPTDLPRTYSSSSNESHIALYRTESASSASNVPDPLPTAGPSTGAASPPVGRGGRRTKAHVANACNNCKRAHLSCDVDRPCGRCVATGKAETCRDVPHKKRGRPRLRDEGQFQVQQPGVVLETANSPEAGSPTVRSIAGAKHRRMSSLRTLRAQAGETGVQPTTPTLAPAPVAAGHGQPTAATPTTSLVPLPRQPRLAPSPEIPIAFLDTDFVILKANTAFQRLFSWLQEIRGIRLSDIARPIEGDSFQNPRNRLREEREIREPAYLPPILQPRLDPVAGIGTTDHDVEEVTRGFNDHQFAWTFRLGGGVDQTLPVRMRLAKTSVYFVTLFLPPLPPTTGTEQIAVQPPAPPAVMFPPPVAPPVAPFQGSPRMMEQQSGISEPPAMYYPFATAGAYHARPYDYLAYQQHPPYPPQYLPQQPQMLPPPPSLLSSDRPGTSGSGSSGPVAPQAGMAPQHQRSSSGASITHQNQQSTPQQTPFLPPIHVGRPRSGTMESLGRHVQTRLRADSGATVPFLQSSPVQGQQRPGMERASSSESEGGESLRKRRRLDINEMLR